MDLVVKLCKADSGLARRITTTVGVRVCLVKYSARAFTKKIGVPSRMNLCQTTMGVPSRALHGEATFPFQCVNIGRMIGEVVQMFEFSCSARFSSC